MNHVKDAALPCLQNKGTVFSSADIADQVDVVDSDPSEMEASVSVPE